MKPRTGKFLLAVLSCASFLAVEALEVTAVVPNGNDASRLLDGDSSDSKAWQGFGDKVTLDFNFSRPEKIARMRIHPGMRCFSAMPSTEGGPKEVRILGRNGGKYTPLLEGTVTLPRDPQSGDDFFVDIDLPEREVDGIRLEILSGYDEGFRVNSPNKSVVPPEKRSMNIREVNFLTAEGVAAEKRKIRERFAAAADFLAEVDRVASQDSRIGKALTAAWGNRIEELRKLLESGNEAELLWRNYRYLDRQISPYLRAVEAEAGAPGVTLTLKNVDPEAKPGTPVNFPLNFQLLEAVAGKKLSRFNVTVEALRNGTAEKLTVNVMPLTPDRSDLVWNLGVDADGYKITIAPAGDDDQPGLRRLIGNGDQLMQNRNAKVALPWNFWNVRFRDIFADGKPALIAGRWTDYAHIYRNVGKPGEFKFNEAAHYIARDPFDELIGTDEHHGLAFSVVESIDYDNDGRRDIFMARHYNTVPLFIRNISAAPGGIDYASPITVSTLDRGRRYTYGDLDGDGIADAIGVRLVGTAVETVFLKGLGLDSKGEPLFDKPQKLALEIPDSTETSRTNSACTPTVSLDDLNGDGILDLSVSVPAHLYVFFNEGNAKGFKFGARRQVKHVSGKNFANDFYFPNFGWADINGDGIADLFERTANFYYPAVGSVLTIADSRVNNNKWLEKQLELGDNYVGLGSFEIVDIDGDGELEFCQVGSGMELSWFRFKDGMFERLPSIRLEPANAQRYGCPDNTEYGSLYSQVRIADFDGDGRPDVLLNTEHNWTMGYFSLYLNLGDGKFSPEIKLTPKPDTSHLKTVKSPTGRALEVTPETSLDYLSFETAGLLAPEAGKIEFSFASDSDEVPGIGRTFFSSSFWDKKRYNNKTLYENYRSNKTLAEFLDDNPGFSLVQLPDGVIRCQLGKKSFSSAAPVKFAKGAWHTVTLSWDASGTVLSIDGREIARSADRPEQFAERFHLGSMAWLAVQHFREYPGRRPTHPVDFSTPASGWFDNLKFTGADGRETLSLDFDRNFGPLALRSTLAYRCNPGVVEDFRGGPALISHFDDNRRTEMPGAKARLYAVPFVREAGKAPKFGEPVGLSLTDGTPFYAHTRTVVVPYDWNNDGATDIILSTENYANKYNVGIELFLNDGKWNFTRTADPEIKRLNDLLTAHHDVKLAFANLSGAELPDMVVWTDPGIRAYSRAYLSQPAPKLTIERIER